MTEQEQANEVIDGEIHYHIEKRLANRLDKMCRRLTDTGDQNGYIINHGMTGCLAGDTIISINRAKLRKDYTIKYLYNALNDNPDKIRLMHGFDKSIQTHIRAFNGKEIRLHKIINAIYSGKKKVYLLTLMDGKTIKATANHKFLTRDGWKELFSLQVGDELMCDKDRPSKLKRKRIRLKDISLKVDYHPFKNPLNNQVDVHRLIYEARMNELEFLKYIDILLNEPELAKTLNYIDTEFHVVHHKDGCHYNNSIDNLELMTKENHYKLHGNSNYSNFSQGIPQWIEIKSIDSLGIEEDTYDIECEEPHHNFVANGIVVHNSGKTNTSVVEAHYISQKTKMPIHLFFRLDDMIEFAKNNLNCIIIWDEPAFTSLSTDVMTTMNKDLFRFINTARLKRHLTIINFTKFWRFNSDILTDTAQFMVHMNDRIDKKGRFLYLPQENLDRLWGDWQKYKRKNYAKYKTFGGSMPFIYIKWFDKLHITINGKQNATYQDYLNARDKAINRIGNTTKVSIKEKKLYELRRNIAKMANKLADEKVLTKQDLADMLGIDRKRFLDWGREDRDKDNFQ